MYLAWHQSYSLSGIYSKLPVTSSRFILSSMILYLLTVKCLCPYIQRPKIWKPAYLFGPMRLQKVKQESISFVKNNLMLQIFWLNSANYYISWRFEIILKMGADLRNVLCNHRCQNNYEENISYFKASAVCWATNVSRQYRLRTQITLRALLVEPLKFLRHYLFRTHYG